MSQPYKYFIDSNPASLKRGKYLFSYIYNYYIGITAEFEISSLIMSNDMSVTVMILLTVNCSM